MNNHQYIASLIRRMDITLLCLLPLIKDQDLMVKITGNDYLGIRLPPFLELLPFDEDYPNSFDPDHQILIRVGESTLILTITKLANPHNKDYLKQLALSENYLCELLVFEEGGLQP